MVSAAPRNRHLLILRYVWVLVPFMVLWLWEPGLDVTMGSGNLAHLKAGVGAVVLYLALRTFLAYKGDPWQTGKLRWYTLYPPIDILAVGLIVYLCDREPLSNLIVLYLLAVIGAAQSLSVPWIFATAAEVAAVELVATWNHHLKGPFASVYAYVFLFAGGAISGLLARAAAMNREELAITRDRERIALEMHDGVQGHLVTIASQLELIGLLIPTQPDKSIELAGEGRDLARLAADELRYLVQRMRSPSMAAGFVPALRQFAFNLAERANLNLRTEIGELPAMKPETEHALFRVAQEALTNAVKHSKATQIQFDLSAKNNRLEMRIEDDGVGVNDDVQGRSGLESMESRAVSCGGTLKIDRGPLGGVRVLAEVPIR